MRTLLEGKKVAVLVEDNYMANEIAFYTEYFSELGAEIDFISNLWGLDSRVLVSKPDGEAKIVETMIVSNDIAECKSEDYIIVISSESFISSKLQEVPLYENSNVTSLYRMTGDNNFITDVFSNAKIVKGTLSNEFIKDESHVVINNNVVAAKAEANLRIYGEALICTYLMLSNNQLIG